MAEKKNKKGIHWCRLCSTEFRGLDAYENHNCPKKASITRAILHAVRKK